MALGAGGGAGSGLLATEADATGGALAIAGGAGAYVWGALRVRRRHPRRPWPLYRTIPFLLGLLVINLALGFTGNTDWRAHLGGLAVGALLGFVYDYAGELRDRNTALVFTVGGSVAVLAILALLITSVAPGHFNLN